jgi:hypothetical protein
VINYLEAMTRWFTAAKRFFGQIIHPLGLSDKSNPSKSLLLSKTPPYSIKAPVDFMRILGQTIVSHTP